MTLTVAPACSHLKRRDPHPHSIRRRREPHRRMPRSLRKSTAHLVRLWDRRPRHDLGSLYGSVQSNKGREYMSVETEAGLSRSKLLKRAAIVGGAAVAWS